MLFLMVTEERRFLFFSSDIQRQRIYDRYYSISNLRNRAEQYSAGDTHSDLWIGLAETFRIFRNEESAQALGLSPLNGELFGSDACKDIEEASCTNEDFLRAMRALSTFNDDSIRRRVNYAHLDVEEFGSVYESLLDYRPVVDLGQISSARPSFQLAAGTERKQTGSYYTPPELVRELVESALVPVMEERLATAKTQEDKERTLLDLKVCDPASGSGHFLLAAARRIARELARVRTGEDEPDPASYRTALRDVVRHCIYAVDKNPLAVDLCKVALWIESHAVGLPLGFLDHHIKCGDSLIGVMDTSVLAKGIPNEAYKAVTGDNKDAATLYRRRNTKELQGQRAMNLGGLSSLMQSLAGDFAAFGGLEERNPAEVHAKEKLYNEMRGPDSDWWERKTACDLWTYAFFAPLQMPGIDGLDGVPTTEDVREAISQPTSSNSKLLAKAVHASSDLGFFHWPLEFPEVSNVGGFDVVLGNPPWDQVQLDPREFFSTRDRNISEQPNMAARNRAIQSLAISNITLYAQYESAVRTINGVQKFIHSSGRFPNTSYGRLNSAPLFAEQCLALAASIGRCGVIVPTGIATDSFNQYFFSNIVDKRSLVSLYDFENREKVFQGIDSRLKFCLLTLTGKERPSAEAEFAFFLYRTEQLQDTERRFTLGPEDFALFNPNTRTCPTFRTRNDAQLAARLFRRAGVLWKEERNGQQEDNPWGVSFQLMFMMNTDSRLFRTQQQLSADGWELEGNIFTQGAERYFPLYEAKLFHQYDHRFATFQDADEDALRGGNAEDISVEEKTNPATVVIPRYWVPKEDVDQRLTLNTDEESSLANKLSKLKTYQLNKVG